MCTTQILIQILDSEFFASIVKIVCAQVFGFTEFKSEIKLKIRYVRPLGRSFEPIFMKFTWLVRVYLRMYPIVFGNSWLNRTTDIEENVPQNQVFGFHSIGRGVFEENT